MISDQHNPTSAHTDSYQSQTKIESLESVRGLAALLIVLYHIPLWNSINSLSILRNGYLMVQLFFVLSGFVIYTAYSNKIKSKNDLIRFQFLRFGRLYPVHLTFLIVFVLIEISKYYAQSKFHIVSQSSQPFQINSGWALFQNLFLVQSLGPTNNAESFNVPAWSISAEFYTYLLFAFTTLYFGKSKIFVFAGLFITSLFLMVTDNTFGSYYLLSCFSGFFLGCLVADLKLRTVIELPGYCSLLAFSSIILFLIFKQTAGYDEPIYFLTALLILTLTSTKNGVLNSFLKFRFFTWLGTISYSLYMSHFCIIWIVNQFLRIVFKKPEILTHGKIVPQLTNIETLIAFPITMVLTLTLGTLVYQFIEAPFRIKSRQYQFPDNLFAKTAITAV